MISRPTPANTDEDFRFPVSLPCRAKGPREPLERADAADPIDPADRGGWVRALVSER